MLGSAALFKSHYEKDDKAFVIQTEKNFKLICFLVLLAGCFLLYGQTLFFDFVWDDHIEVLGNDVFHHWSNLGKFFTVPYWTLLTGGFAPYHRPMIPIMIAAVSTFFGKNPFGYHLLSFILYASTVWVYFLFLKTLPISKRVVLFATVLFLIHPIHAEAVSWGSARPVLLSGLCFVSCLYFSRKSLPLLSFLFFAVGLLTYHSILGLIPLVFFADWIFGDKPRWGLPLSKAAEYAGYLILTAGFIFYCLVLFHKMGETDLRPFYSPATANMIYGGNPLDKILAPLNTLSRYSELLLFPMNLTPDASFAASSLSVSALGCLILIGSVSFFLLKTEHSKTIQFSLAWMLCGLLTVGNFVPQGGLFADRYAFIASMGFALWAGCVLEIFFKAVDRRFSQSKKIRIMTFGCIFGLLIFKTFTYSQIWQNEFRFWYEASILSPQKARTHQKLGAVMEQAGFLKEALDEYKKTLALDPEHFISVYQQLSDVLEKMGRHEEASVYLTAFQAKVRQLAEVQKLSQSREPLLTISH